MDRDRLWRNVSNQYERIQAVAPDGYEPLVEVYLAGRNDPVVPAYVQTSRRPEFPWALLQAKSVRDHSTQPRESDEYWVYVPESLISRVEIRFVPKGERPIGFGVREVDEFEVEPPDEGETRE